MVINLNKLIIFEDTKEKKEIMKILNVTLDTFRNEVIGKTFLFSDDTSVSIDINTSEVYDMDGITNVSNSKKEAIEKLIKTSIIL